MLASKYLQVCQWTHCSVAVLLVLEGRNTVVEAAVLKRARGNVRTPGDMQTSACC